MGQDFRSKITPAELRATIADLGLSQRSFAKLVCIPRESINRACNSRNFVRVDIAIALRLAQVIAGLRAIVHDGARRPGWRKVKAVLALAEDPVVLQQRKKGKTGARYKPRKPRFDPPLLRVTPPKPTDNMPTAVHPGGKAPQGFHYTMRGHTWMLERDWPERHGSI